VNTTQTAKLTASDGAPNDRLGWSTSASGNTITVGAPYVSIGSNQNQGAAYVYVKPVSGWSNTTQTAKLTASDGGKDDTLGWTVANRGTTIMPGAPNATINSNYSEGAMYVFRKKKP
jgi:hypothetical protein